SDHPATTVFTDRGERADRTFERVEGVSTPTRGVNIECHFVIVAADLTCGHTEITPVLDAVSDTLFDVRAAFPKTRSANPTVASHSSASIRVAPAPGMAFWTT